MASEPRCPRCGALVEPHWDWCHQCGFDGEAEDPGGRPPTTDGAEPVAGPSGRGALWAEPAARRVYEPDDEPGRWRVVSIALVIVAAFSLSAIAAQFFLVDRGDSSTSVLSVADLGGQGEQTPLDDGWRQLSSAGHPLQLEVPPNLWRTHDAVRLGPTEAARATIWVDIEEASGRYVFVAAVPLDGTSLHAVDGALPPLDVSSLDLAPLRRSSMAEPVPATLPGGPGWRSSGETTGGAPLEAATTLVDRTLVVLAVADPDRARATAELDRMAGSVERR